MVENLKYKHYSIKLLNFPEYTDSWNLSNCSTTSNILSQKEVACAPITQRLDSIVFHCFHFRSFACIRLDILLQYQIHRNPTSNSDVHPTPEEVIWLGQAAKVAENRKDVLIGYVCSDTPFCRMLIMKRHVQQLLVFTLCCARKKKKKD